MKHILLFALALPLLGQDSTDDKSTASPPFTITFPKCFSTNTGCSDMLTFNPPEARIQIVGSGPMSFCRKDGKCLELYADGKIVQPDTTRMSYREIVEWIIAVLKEQSK